MRTFHDMMRRGSAGALAVGAIAPGDQIPAITIDEGFNPIGKVDMAEVTAGKKTIIMGLPGAFTPC